MINYNLESVPIPRCDFVFFCLIFLFLQWISQKKAAAASVQNAHWSFRTNPKTNLADWGQPFLKMTQQALNWTSNSARNHPHLPRWFTSRRLSETAVTVGAIYLHLLCLRLENSFFHTKSRFTQVRGFPTITLLYSLPKFSSTCKHMPCHHHPYHSTFIAVTKEEGTEAVSIASL